MKNKYFVIDVSKLFEKLNIKSDRTKNLTKHIGLSFIYKPISIILNLIIISLSIKILGDVNYGIWLTISSLVVWMRFFDGGIGYGFHNKFIEATSKGDYTLGKSYVSSTYYTLLIISTLLILIFTIISFFVDWGNFLNTSEVGFLELRYIAIFVFFGFFCELVLKTILIIYEANQKPSIRKLYEVLVNFTSLLFIIVLWNIEKKSLLLYAIIISLIPSIILLLFSFKSFTSDFKLFSPSISFFNKKLIRDIFGLGFKFFLIQIFNVVIFSTDNIIISQLFNPKDVTPYNISLKYFSLLIVVFTIITSAYWAAIKDAIVKKEAIWIKKSMKTMIIFSFFFSILSLLMILPANWFYNIWIGEELKISHMLNIFMSVYVISMVLIQPYKIFLNGSGNVKIQVWIYGIGAFLNIPLSIFFVKYIGFGVEGVILATIFCNVLGLIAFPIYYKLKYKDLLKIT